MIPAHAFRLLSKLAQFFSIIFRKKFNEKNSFGWTSTEKSLTKFPKNLVLPPTGRGRQLCLPSCSGLFGCKLRNELSISTISKVRCDNGANFIICGRSAELFSNFSGKIGTSQSASSCRIRHKNARQLLELAAETVRSATHVTSSST